MSRKKDIKDINLSFCFFVSRYKKNNFILLYLKKKKKKEMAKIKQSFRYYCVIDFEATNEEDPWRSGHGKEDYPSEIIQFPAVLIDSSTTEIVKLNTYK